MSPSPFASALADMDTALDAQMGEDVGFVPSVRGDFAATPDPDRPAFDVVALVHEVDPSSADTGGMLTRVRYDEFELEIDRRQLVGRTIRKGDEVLLLERAGSPRYAVARVDDTDRGRLRVTLATGKVD